MIAFTDSAGATRRLAAAVAELVRPGDVLLLTGDLGAGKTVFAQGLGEALGVDEPLTSPTFTLHNRYTGRLVVNHLDVYRLEHPSEILDLGLVELLDTDAVALIEWGDTIAEAIPHDYLEVRLARGEGDDDRVVELRPAGPRWTARTRALRTAVAEWLGDRPDLPELDGDVDVGPGGPPC